MFKAQIYTDGLRNSPHEYNASKSEILAPVSEKYILDESLDNASIVVAFIDRAEPFRPFTWVSLDDTETGDDAEFWLVQNDEVTEYPTLGKCTHKILLVEAVKYLERFMVGTKTVTQPLETDWSAYGQMDAYMYGRVTVGVNINYNNAFRTPIEEETTINISSIDYIFGDAIDSGDRDIVRNIRVKIFRSGNLIYTINLSSVTSSSTYTLPSIPDGAETVTVKYEFEYYQSDMWTPQTISFDMVVYGNASISRIYLSNVIDDVLQTVEPRINTDSARFDFESSQIGGRDPSQIISPEYTFTDATLFEVMSTIGYELFAVPKLSVSVSNGVPSFKIYFSPFVKNQAADLEGIYAVNGETATRDMEQYASGLDSNAEGLVPTYVPSTTDGYLGAPALDIPKTMRAEDGEYRVTEATGVISTDFPIERIVSVKVAYNSNTYYDITPYIYEQTEYAALSSYEKLYPWSKQYALYYVQGQKNIKGLSFERENLLSQVFEDPAILAIFKAVTNNPNANTNFWTTANQALFKFKVVYVPVVSLKMRQRQADTDGNISATLLSYNQGANKIDSTEFGMHLAGTITRLGVPQYTRLYTCSRNIARSKGRNLVGCALPNGHVITAVTVEYFASHAKLMISATTEFNRISQYIGIRSQIRQYEISEKLAQDRNVVFEDYLVISDGAYTKTDQGTTMLTEDFFNHLIVRFANGSPAGEHKRVDLALLWGKSQSNLDLAKVMLPVISYGAGRSLVFNVQTLDNYGAGYGTNITNTSSDNINDAYTIQENIRYTDSLGRVDLLRLAFFSSENETVAGALVNSPRFFPALDPSDEEDITRDRIYALRLLGTSLEYPIKIRKDNRERLALTYQIHVIGDSDDGYIVSPNIGSLLGFCNTPRELYLSVSTDPITPNMTHISGALSKKLSSLLYYGSREGTVVTFYPGSEQSTFAAISTNASGKSWAITTSQNRILFGKNMTITPSTPLPTFSFSGVHKIDND